MNLRNLTFSVAIVMSGAILLFLFLEIMGVRLHTMACWITSNCVQDAHQDDTKQENKVLAMIPKFDEGLMDAYTDKLTEDMYMMMVNSNLIKNDYYSIMNKMQDVHDQYKKDIENAKYWLDMNSIQRSQPFFWNVIYEQRELLSLAQERKSLIKSWNTNLEEMKATIDDDENNIFTASGDNKVLQENEIVTAKNQSGYIEPGNNRLRVDEDAFKSYEDDMFPSEELLVDEQKILGGGI
ncbi:hypothetical protein [Komagataeibacter nataicola]|uniref:hypothetical protein n=1 Tax=Komagataeibacter nataicola TaxID=265960 RepID=UPI0011B4BC01|nr:hypothetical protein [Komagataeibacter nataicola]WNM10299.1 hypothetical protein RI056_18540 [Komagataeibacter nataicola]GBR23416.1 hypothetical protein AA0616_2517 [Komagataeibacter nataicola NRIC 0616]